MSKLFKIVLTPLFVLLFINIYGQVPTISSFSPTSGNVGTTVTITGTNFSTTLANNVVYFGAAKATVSAATATSLTVTVPARSTYEPIAVINTSTGKVAQSKTPFKVTNSTISSFPVSSSSFVAPVNITSAAGASSWYEIGDMISVADYDGDGKPDIAKGSNTTNVNVLRNVITTSGSIASSSFSSAGNFTTGSASFEIASGDIDGDGKLDIVSIGTSNFSILRNTSTSGTISFATKVDVSASYQYRVKLADIDGDGRLDVITSSNYSSNFNVYLNTSSVGSISFNTTPTTISGLNGSRHITIGDINMDGKTDVIAANEGTMNALLFLNTSTSGSVSFGSGIAVAGGYWYNSVGDFDGDGKNDILSNGGNVSLLTNNYTSGTFTSSNLTTASNISSADGLSYTTQSDFNGDGKLDYFTSFQNSGSYVYWYKNNYISGSFSSSSFAASSATFSTPYQMIICDFDGDGKQDIVSSASSNLYVQIARNKIGEDPTITTTGTLTSFTTCSGINSSNQSFNVSGSNLTANISLTAPTGFEISTASGSGFASSLTLTQSSGTVASTTIYVRTTTAATGNPSGNIVLSSTGATTVNVAASGTINALPTITGTLTTTTIGTTQLTGSATANASTPWQSANTSVATISNTGLVSGVSVGTSTITYTNTNGCIKTALVTVTVPPPAISTTASLSAFTKCSGSISNAQTFTVSGQYLTANIALAALTGFEYSTDGTTYASTLSLAPTSGTLNATTVYVRMTAAVATNPSGNIVLSTTGGSNVNVAASGTINALPTITGTTYLTSNGTAQLTGSGTANASNPWISSNTNILTVNSTGAITAISIGTSTITYTNSNGCSVSTIASVNNPAPKISSFAPTSGNVGSSITITGTDFSANNANNIVLFGSVKGTVTASTSTSLTVTVPAGAKVSSIKIINTENNLSGVSSKSFVPTYSNANPANIASANFTALQMTTGTSPAAVTSATWSGVRHNGAVSDIDGDGKVDLLMVDNTNSRVAIYSNAATSGSLSIANFSTVTYATTVSAPTDIEVEDINNDGKPDMVVTNGGTTLSILINTSTTGNISFATKQDFTVAISMIVRVADLNEDGRPDIITAGRGASSVNIYSNTTSLPSNTITLSTATNLTGAASIFDIVIKDINNDNKPDINLAASTYYAFINTNTTPNTVSFSQTMSKATSAGLYSLQVEDYNLDGKNDVVFGFMGAVNGGMFQNNYSSGNIANTDFSTEITINNLSNSSSQYAWQLQSGDFNGDGKPDILNSDFNAGSNVRIVTNNNIMGSGNTLSTANFSGAYIGTSSSYGNSFAVDLDNDGKPDWANFSYNRIDIGRNKIGEDPTITKSSNLNAFVTCPSTASPSQTFTVSGSFLTANISISVPTGYEVSTSAASGYATSLTLTQTNGIVTNTTIYIRLASTASGTPAGNISISSTGATTQTIAVSGTLNSLPSISVHPSITAQSKCINVAATPLTVTAAGTNIAYQWYSNSSNSNTGGTAITGANSATYTPSTSSAGALYYYVVISGTCTPNATSNVSGLVTTNALPTVTIGSITNPIATATSFSLPYSGATGTPNQYSIAVGSANIMSSFVAVNNATLSTSPITVTIPASIANTYDFNLVVKNTTTGCSSNNIPFSITVNKANPTLSGFGTITKSFGAANFNLTNPTSASTGTFTYTISDPNIATISGNTVTIVGAGTATITATQAADNSYNTASVSTTLTVSKALPSLSNFGSITKIFGDNTFTLTDPTSASTGTFSYTSSNNNVVSITGNTVSIIGAGTATITATQASDANYNSNSIASSITVSKIAPTLTNFSDLTNNYGDAAFVLTAPTSNSNGAFTYSSSNASVATITGSTVTIIGAGTTTITASQATSSNYNAGTISALLTVNKIDPTLNSFNAINKVYGSAPFTVTAPTSNSNGSFAYSISDPNVATINGSIITIIGAGTASITATQAGNNNFTNNNNTITASITINKAIPTQSGFNSINKMIGDADFALSNPNSNSTGNFTFTSSDQNIATVTGNMVSIISTGTVTITASQSADNNYEAKSVTASLNITKPNPSLSNFGNISKTYGDADFVITDPTSNSNGNFTYTSSNSSIASIVGSTISIIGSGTVTITASQSSTSNYNAGIINATLTINKANPSITGFNTINKIFGDGSFSITAPNSNSNGAFTYTSSNTSVATISGSTITILGAGTATITATQTSNNNYNSGNISTTLTVAKANPSFGNFNNINKVVGDANFNITAPTSNSAGAISYSISDLAVATVTGSTVSILGAGTVTITASQASTSNYNAGTISTTLTVTQANPTITGFVNINKVYGNNPFALTAPTSNSNGSFSFTSSNSNVVSIVGNIVTIVGAGTASITATQASTNNYNTASVTASITVNKANPTITGFNTINKTYGDTTFSITTPSSNSGGTFTYSSSNTSIAVVSGNNINIVGAGTATITATQASDNNYNAGTINTSIVIAKANPILGTFNSFTKTIGDASFTITAPTSNSNGNFTYTSSNLNVASVTGNTVNITGAGTATLTATQASTNNFNSRSVSTTITVLQQLNNVRLVNDSFDTHIDTLFSSNVSINDSAPSVIYGNVVPDVNNISGATLNIQSNGIISFNANQPGIYKYTISGCSTNNQQNCPTSLLTIKANYLPQASINLYYNTLLATDTAKLVTNFSNGIAPYSIVIKNNKDTVKQSFYNLSNNNTLLLAPRKDSAIYSILYIKDANNVTRYNRFSKDTANLHIVKPDIRLTLKATPPQPISDSTLQMNLLLSIENKGAIDVNGVQVLADLTKVFPPGMEYILDSVSTVDSTILLNPNYTGVNTTLRTNSSNSFSVSTVRSNSTVLSQAELFNFGVNLLKQQKGNVNFKFRIKPNAVTNPLVLQFSSTGNALLKQNDGSVSTTPAKTSSTDGANPTNSNSKPIPAYVPIVPVNYIGTALEGSLPTVVNGGYVFHYNTLIKNYSNGNLDAVNAILDLSNSFSRPDSAYVTFGTTNNSSIVFNTNFDGFNDKRLFSNLGLLAVGDTLLAGFDIHVRTNKLQYSWPLSITSNAVTSLYNTPVSDESFNGSNPDPNNDQKPEERSITISSVGFTAPTNPTVRSLVYSLGNPSNPSDVSNMIISTPTGTIPSWCDVNGGNCNVIPPSLPTNSGKFIWCIKAYDTLSGQYSANCMMDTLTMLPSLTVRKLTYVKTVTTNPINISSSIVAISAGSVVRWCDANGNNCSFNTPTTPTNIGTYIWTVSAVDTVNNLVSVGVIKDTVNILDPYRVVDLTKRLDEVSMNPDGSFNIKFNFVVSNNSGQILNNVVIKDNLTTVFGNNVEYTVLSVNNTGYLNVNNSYNGVTDINLVNNNVILLNNKQDTVQLTLLVKGNRIDGNYSNSASALVNTHYGTFTITSNDPILNPTNTNNRIATNFVIPKLDVVVAGGFSPNNDGIDDTWIIERPYGTKIAVRVFNRWGNEVFQSDDYLNDWRGKGQNNFLGTDIPEGTYFYAVIVTTNDNKTYKLSGSLTIVK